MKKPTMDSLRQMVSNQQQRESRPEMNQSTDSQAADWVWQMAAEIYGEQWVRENGETPSNMWKLALSGLESNAVTNGIKQMIEQRIEWPPNLPKFMEIAMGIDTDAAYDRFMSHKPALGDVEKKTRSDCGTECRGKLSEDAGRAKFRKTYLKWQKAQDNDQWPARQLYAPSKLSMVKSSDRMIEERMFSDKAKTRLEIRIDRMRAGL